MKNIICFAMAALTALWLQVSAQAETEVIKLTANGDMDILPAVNGNYVVWQGLRGGDWEIFLYDIAAAQTTQLTDNDYDDIAARTDGTHVVWLGMNAAGGNIFMYDIPGRQLTQVTDNGKIKSWPQIGEGRIVWASQQVADSILPGEIELYELGSGTTSTISTAVDPEGTLDDHTPSIGDNKVIWAQTGLDNLETLFIHDLTTGATFPAPADFTPGFGPTRSGDLAITTKFDGHDREIFLHHLRLGRDEQLTDNSVDEKQPGIDGNHLVWVGGQGAEQEIYLGIYRSLMLVSPGDGLISQAKKYPVFRWEGTGYDRFKVQFSSARDFIDNLTIVTFPPDDAWLSEPSFTVAGEQARMLNRLGKGLQPLYWRVQAKDAYGNEKFSDVRSLIKKPVTSN